MLSWSGKGSFSARFFAYDLNCFSDVNVSKIRRERSHNFEPVQVRKWFTKKIDGFQIAWNKISLIAQVIPFLLLEIFQISNIEFNCPAFLKYIFKGK